MYWNQANPNSHCVFATQIRHSQQSWKVLPSLLTAETCTKSLASAVSVLSFVGPPATHGRPAIWQIGLKVNESETNPILPILLTNPGLRKNIQGLHQLSGSTTPSCKIPYTSISFILYAFTSRNSSLQGKLPPLFQKSRWFQFLHRVKVKVILPQAVTKLLMANVRIQVAVYKHLTRT